VATCNFEVEGAHTYFVTAGDDGEWVLVHNASRAKPGTYSSLINNTTFRRQVRQAFNPGAKKRTLCRSKIAYRYYLEGSDFKAKGRYFTSSFYSTSAGARRALALPNENLAKDYVKVRIPAGTDIIEGTARSKTGSPKTFGPHAKGGGPQIYLPDPSMLEIIGKGKTK
jgi:hypothetical protein